MSNLFPNSSIVQYAQVKQHRNYISKKDFNQEIRQYAPNFKHKDGKIYASKDGEPYWVVTVSPYHPNFRSQVEDGVWPIVEPLINKNYLTVSSCEGHGIDQKLIVSLVFENIEDAKKFVNECSSVPGWHFTINDKERKICKTVKSNNVLSEEITVNLNNQFEEFRRYNLLFFKNYERYVYVEMKLYKFPQSLFKRLYYRFILVKPYKDFFIYKQKMIDFLNNQLSTNDK